MSKYTPGPWAVQELNADDYEDGGLAVITAGKSETRVCTVSGFGNHEANARLIAAAPDMAEALQAMFKHCCFVHRYWGEDCNGKKADAAVAAGHAALKEAGLT